ncbi:MAG: Heme exporter protein B [Candidatus Tokpelaia hoelldobleri]|uniref:Heme exporter protein B n=1 Tax=Candidatus Tokpelaia hoelldobleri TaxID=1902579 RepID=A0A1U9JVI5_9HYPH|nr:MAG: Heme exporter protein B [Candidatus Tokpelaia hoelldoblerii]
MISLFLRDLRLGFRAGDRLAGSLVFFLAVITITPFALGTENGILAHTGAGMIWIAALLAILLGLEQLFASDHADGSLEIMVRETDFPALAGMVAVKCLAHWASHVLPLIIITPLLAVFLQMEPEMIGATALSLLLGTPAIIFIGAAGAALTVSLPRGGVLTAIITLPLVIPVVIFGVTAIHAFHTGQNAAQPLLFLSGLSLFFAVIGSAAAAAALKYMVE